MTQNQVKEIIYSLQRYYPRAYEQVLSEAALFVCSFTLEPVLHSRFATWLAVIVLLAADLAAALLFQTTNDRFLAVNNLVLIVGITNLCAQSGMKARDIALFGGSWPSTMWSPPPGFR